MTPRREPNFYYVTFLLQIVKESQKRNTSQQVFPLLLPACGITLVPILNPSLVGDFFSSREASYYSLSASFCDFL